MMDGLPPDGNETWFSWNLQTPAHALPLGCNPFSLVLVSTPSLSQKNS